ncbi:NADH dehydrogenase [ubiquinone] 1 alpha subcomplex subunit 10, mitochondrial-like [Styela clava]
MIASVVCRQAGLAAVKNSIPGVTKCFSVAGFHTTTPERSTLGEFIQTVRFKYFNNIRHNLDNDKWAKIFVVEGNIKSGKGAFAKEFAEKLDLRYFPSVEPEYQVTHNCHPEHLERTLNLFHTITRLSLEDFYKNPQDWPHIGRYQLEMTSARFMQYAHAVCHLLWTGQGCVLERGYFGLEVFEHAIRKLNLVPEKVLEHYYLMRARMTPELLTPQCVIYLDVEPEQCHENLQRSGIEWEKHIPLEFLQAMDEGYNMKYLPSAPTAGTKVLRFDWTKPEAVDDIILDLDDMPTLQEKESKWDSHRAILMRYNDYLADPQNINKLINHQITPVEELWYPKWVHWATDNFNYSRTKTNDKFYWLAEEPARKYSYKKRYGWLFHGLNLPWR